LGAFKVPGHVFCVREPIKKEENKMGIIVFEFDEKDLSIQWPGNRKELLTSYVATLWERMMATATFFPEKKEAGKTYFQFATDSLVENANLAYVTDTYPGKHVPGKIMMIYTANFTVREFEGWLKSENSKQYHREFNRRQLSVAQVYFSLGGSPVSNEFQGDEIQDYITKKLVIATPLQKLIADAETKLKKTHRTGMRKDMLDELNALDHSLKPQEKILEDAMPILTKYGVYAGKDHEKNTGWRWGGFVMGLFGARDKAPLMFSSAFKRTTAELTTQYNPIDKNYLVAKK